jgi:Cu+-exporting ATPase
MTRTDQLLKSEFSCFYCGTPSGLSKYCCEACHRLDVGFKRLNEGHFKKNSKFQYLDNPENQSLYRLSKEQNIFKFFIENIQCSSCVHLLEKIPDYYPECTLSRLNIGTSELYIELTEKAKLSEIADLILELGYEAKIIKLTEDVNFQIQKEQRNDLKRIAVAGACAGNIMIFSIPIYTGVQGDLLLLFKVLSMLLFLPVVFYSAIPFYRGAWTSLRIKKIHIDLPITIALIAGFVFSVYNLAMGSDQFYFDSTASFLFLILVARFFVKKTQQKFLSPQNLKSQIRNETYVLSNQSVVLPENIQTNDVFTVSQDQIIPVDGELLSQFALIDTSYMSGESAPYSFTEGMKLFAGYRLLSDSVKMKCDSRMNETRISDLLRQSYQNLLTKSEYLNLADRLAQKLILLVFGIATIFLIVYGMTHNFKDAFDRALALIVVACPCALAFGSPLTMAMAYKKAHLKGITIRNPDVFEKISSIQNIFFDKTGTLTDGQLDIAYTWPEIVPNDMKALLVQLEKISHHPVAFALRKSWSKDAIHEVTPVFITHEEIFGLGIRASTDSDTYEVKALSSQVCDEQTEMAIALYKNNVVQCRIYFQDKIRPESAEIVQYLHSKNKNCFLLSGDKKRKAQNVGTACAIKNENIYSSLYPEDKEQIISKYANTLMIGDGVNDSLAMSQSDVSIAIKGSLEVALNTSDVFFMRSGLSPLLDLFSINQTIHSTLRRNLALSLIYNVLAGVCALLGFINPLWAAVLMPISSFIVILSTLWGFSK